MSDMIILPAPQTPVTIQKCLHLKEEKLLAPSIDLN